MKGVRFVVFTGTFAAAAAIFGGCGTSRPNAGDPGGNPPTQERCSTPGQTRECKVVLAEIGGSRTCGTGTQRCDAGGYWSACTLASGGTIESLNLGLAGITQTGVLKPMSVTAPSPDATACISPCDLNCVGYDEPCYPLTFEGGIPSLYGASDPFSAYNALPAAFQTNPGTCTIGAGDECGQDAYCLTGGGCNDFGTAGLSRSAGCAAGIDLTLAQPCKLGSAGAPQLTICNRGTAPANSGTVTISGSATAWPQPHTGTQPAQTGSCSFNLTTNPLLPGQCRNFGASACTGVSFAAPLGLKVNDSATPIAECRTGNNYTVWDPATAPACVAIGTAGDGGVEAGVDAGGCTAPPKLTIEDIIGIAGVNNGFTPKLYQGSCYGGSPCQRFPSAATDVAGRLATACQADSYCQATGTVSSGPSNDTSTSPAMPGVYGVNGNGCCIPFDRTTAGVTHNSTANDAADCTGGPDLTTVASCILPGGSGDDPLFEVCNRGDTAVPAGTAIQIQEYPSSVVTGLNPADDCKTAFAAASPKCSYTLPAALAAGSCVKFAGRAPTCSGGWSGNKSYMVNPNFTVTECQINPRDARVGLQPNQDGCQNNFFQMTTSGANRPPPCIIKYDPIVRVESYAQSCPPGQRAQWKEIGWDADVPGTATLKSMVIFEARTRQYLIDGGIGGWGPWTVVGRAMNTPPGGTTYRMDYPTSNVGAAGTLTTDGPGYCPMSGVANCPKNMVATMGAASVSDQLELRITLMPASNATTSYAPTLRYWWLNRECVATE